MKTDLKIVARRFREVWRVLPYQVGVIMVAFSKDRFKYQNWLDNYPIPWKPRSRKKAWTNKGKSPKDTGRALLVKSGRLRRSIRIISTSTNSVTIGSDAPYAAVHNNGERMKFVQRVRRYVRMNRKRDRFTIQAGKQLKKSSRIKYVKSGSGISVVSEHTRAMDYKMPERRFMGASKYQSMQINRWIAAKINSTFKQ